VNEGQDRGLEEQEETEGMAEIDYPFTIFDLKDKRRNRSPSFAVLLRVVYSFFRLAR
jgi:hypothetical protein